MKFTYLGTSSCEGIPALFCNCPDGATHMSIDNIRSIVKRLTDIGVACGHTLHVANHFAHGGQSLYEDLLCMVKNDPIEISYDGRVIELKS